MDFSRIIERHAAFQPAKPALHFQGATWTYAEFWRRIEHASLRLASYGVHRDDRVAFLGYNHPEFLAILFACARLGAVLVPLNFRLALPEHKEILAHSGSSLLVVEGDFHAAAQSLAKDFPQMKMVSIAGPAPEGFFGWSGPMPGGFTPKYEGRDADPLMIVYTSGTTGRPKGAVHTQEAMLWNIVCSTHYHDLVCADHILTALPMFHVGGLCIQTLPALHAGCTVTVQARFDPGAWLDAVATSRPTLSLLVPATIRAVTGHPKWAGADLSSLRMVNTGSSVIPESMIEAFHARGITMTQVWGSTETGPVTIYLRPEDARRKVGFAGHAALHAEIRLVDEAGTDVARGRIGEIWVRAKNLMQGYWRDPDNPAFRDGWFRSGDLAYQDEEGFYKVVGRSKDMIISGGENVYPAELENVLGDCPEVLECAVVGAEDEKWGEVAVAAIVRRPGSTLDEAGVMRLFEGRLARYKHPRRVVFLDNLPKTALGKVQKPELKKLIA